MGHLLKAEGVRVSAGSLAVVQRPADPSGGEATRGGYDAPEERPLSAGRGRRSHGLRLEGRQLQSARQRAAAVVQRARQEAEELRRQARQEGFEEGLRQGLHEGRARGEQLVRQEARQILEQLQQAAEQAGRWRLEALRDAEGDMVEIALAAAEKVVRQRIEQSAEVTREVLRCLLAMEALAAASGRVVVRVHPREWQWLAGQGAGELRAEGPLAIEWVADPALTPGGCVVESDVGIFDASLETRLAAIREALRDGVRHDDSR